MRIDEAAKILASMYNNSPEREKALHVHLFGIKYADEVSGMPLGEVAIRAGITEAYKTEIRKGMNMARYVQLKP